jgi:hypothetical protein
MEMRSSVVRLQRSTRLHVPTDSGRCEGGEEEGEAAGVCFGGARNVGAYALTSRTPLPVLPDTFFVLSVPRCDL